VNAKELQAIKSVADHSSTAFCIFSELGEFIYINDAGKQAQFDFFGRHVDSLVEGAAFNAMVASDWNQQIQRLNGSKSTKTEWMSTYVQQSNHQTTHRRCVLQKIFIDNKLYGYSSEVFDVTDLVNANKDLAIDKDRAERGQLKAESNLKKAIITLIVTVVTAITAMAPVIIEKLANYFVSG